MHTTDVDCSADPEAFDLVVPIPGDLSDSGARVGCGPGTAAGLLSLGAVTVSSAVPIDTSGVEDGCCI